MYLLPSRVLENLTCNFCHKFLSVGPIKVYEDGKIKCGRCPQSAKDGGAVSQYNQIAQFGVFKCVNRLDGCDELLSYHDVDDHEATCHGKSYSCPLCPETRTISTFLMVKHYEDTHGDHLLRRSSFDLDLTKEQSTETYLHRVEDCLFFIECRNNSAETFSLRAVLLGLPNRAQVITQQFSVRFDNLLQKVATEKTPCVAVGSDDYTDFKISKRNYRYAFVEFQLDTPGAIQLVPLPTYRGAENSEFCGPETTPLKKLLLTKFFEQEHPDYSISPTGTCIKKGGTLEIIPWCYICSLEFTAGETYLELDPNTYQWVCWRCEEYCRKKNPDRKFVDQEEITPSSLHLHLLFFCSWGCEKFFNRTSVFKHERVCQKQPKQICPVDFCQYNGQIPKFKKHFSEFHPNSRIYFQDFVKVEFTCTEKFYVGKNSCFSLLEVKGEKLGGKSCCEVKIHPPIGIRGGVEPIGLIFLERFGPCYATVTVEKPCKVRERWDLFSSFFFIKVILKK